MKYATGILKCFLVIFLLGQAVPGWATEIGRVSGLTGRADVSRTGAAPEDLRVDDAVLQRDVLRTKSGSRLTLTMSDGSRLTMAENTLLELKHYQIEEQPAGLLKVTRGRLRALVSKVFSSRSESFQVRTPTAVAGVMGTDFAVIVEARFTRVVVFEGIVMVRNIDPSIPKREILRKNQSTIVWQGAPPMPPVSLKMLIEEVLGVSLHSDQKKSDEKSDQSADGVDEEGLPENGDDIKVIPPDDPILSGEPPSAEPPPTEPPPIEPPPTDHPPPWGGPDPPPPAPPSDPPPPGKPDGPPGPPPYPPGLTKKVE